MTVEIVFFEQTPLLGFKDLPCEWYLQVTMKDGFFKPLFLTCKPTERQIRKHRRKTSHQRKIYIRDGGGDH